MSTPKKKLSHARSGWRRSQTTKTKIGMSFCPQCQTPVRMHTVCRVCGTYRGEKILAVKSKVDRKNDE